MPFMRDRPQQVACAFISTHAWLASPRAFSAAISTCGAHVLVVMRSGRWASMAIEAHAIRVHCLAHLGGPQEADKTCAWFSVQVARRD